MATSLEDLWVLQGAEGIADGIWCLVSQWDTFARDVVGGQLARAADSIGANIAEAYGRFHFGEKLQFLYYARGSVFETKYWLNRALVRELMPSSQVQTYADQMSELARQLNAFARSLKTQRSGNSKPANSVRETHTEYLPNWMNDAAEPLFSETELKWLATHQSLISNLQSRQLT